MSHLPPEGRPQVTGVAPERATQHVLTLMTPVSGSRLLFALGVTRCTRQASLPSANSQ